MKREILFRGKTIDGSCWITGNLIYDEISGATAIVTYANIGGDEYKITDLSEVNCIRVIPETVGQYTGLTDKNGEKIFEGDIVYSYDREEDYDVWCLVKWYEETAGFVLDDDCMYCNFNEEFHNEEIEVVGNIHDNPDMFSPA